MATTIPETVQKVVRDYRLHGRVVAWEPESARVVGGMVGGIGEEIAQIACVPSATQLLNYPTRSREERTCIAIRLIILVTYLDPEEGPERLTAAEMDRLGIFGNKVVLLTTTTVFSGRQNAGVRLGETLHRAEYLTLKISCSRMMNVERRKSPRSGYALAAVHLCLASDREIAVLLYALEFRADPIFLVSPSISQNDMIR